LNLDGVSLDADKDFFIEEGRVRLNVAAGNPGDHKLEGRLLFLENGEETEVQVNLSFSTIAKPNTAVISADKMNVVYRGVDNPMTISIPGIPNNKVKATAPGLKALGGSSYTVRPSRGEFLKIEARGELPDGSQVTTATQFRIKDVPAPSGTVRGEFGSVRMSRSELEKTIVGAELVDFDFDLPIAVSGFKMKIPNQPTIEVKGSRMDAKAVSAIRRASRGDVVRIFDIKTYPTTDTSYFLKPAAQVIVEIIN
jgi:gliding motility-associated protein GldM